MNPGRDWVAWHEAYDDPGTPLAQRLLAVRARITAALDEAPPGPLRAISICAGQGRDLIGVLRGHPRGPDVTARLVELDPRNAEPPAGPPWTPGSLCGVFGNITDGDVARTIRCGRGALVHRDSPAAARWPADVHLRRRR